MAKAVAKKKKPKSSGKMAKRKLEPLQWLRRWVLRLVLGIVAGFVALILLYSVVNPPITHTIWAEQRRLGEVDRMWVPLEEMAPVLARSVVAAEDAQFCRHWGFDARAIQAAIEAGGTRGGSTISQQVVKNVFL